MMNQSLVRQQAKVKLKADQVRLIREIPLGCSGCSVSIWVAHGPIPPQRIALLETFDGVVCTSNSFLEFTRLFNVLKPDVTDYELLRVLLQEAAPGRMVVVDSRRSLGWLARYESVWHPPKHEQGITTLFCNDFEKGRFYRISFSEQGDVEVKVIGPGKRVARR
jgi:hypothetical protein